MKTMLGPTKDKYQIRKAEIINILTHPEKFPLKEVVEILQDCEYNKLEIEIVLKLLYEDGKK